MNRCLPLITGAFLSVLGLIMLSAAGHAAPAKYLFKIASLAPEGSVWATHFDNFSREVTARSNGEITFKVYPGGVMGDDRSMYRKMQIGQLQGGGFTMSGISEVVPDFRVLGIPFLLDSDSEADHVIDGLFPSFQKAFADKGLALIATTEVGFVYPMSTEPIRDLDQMRKSKCWVPSNDPLSQAFFEDIGISPIQLSIPDVLPSLQTGLVNTVFNSFYGAIVLQWFTRTPYINNTPFAYAYGALVFSKKDMDRLPPQYADLIREAAAKNFADLLADARKSNAEALKALQDNGIKIIEATAESLRELEMHRDRTVEKTIGKAFSREIYDKTIRILTEIRSTARTMEN